MSGRLSFFSAYVPAKDAMEELASSVVASCKRCAADGQTLAFAQGVQCKLIAMHEELVSVMEKLPVNLTPTMLNARFEVRVRGIFGVLGLPAEVCAPAMEIGETEEEPLGI